MRNINKDSMVFQFMLKEYEKLYGKFDMHYQAVERSINFYFVLIGAVISFNGLVYNKIDKIQIFHLTGLQSLFLMIICILGYLIYFKVIEHRLLIIAYVKSLNLNRKWFSDNCEDENLSNYLFFKPDVLSPKYYKRFRHFYWEATGLASINSIFCSVFILNMFIRFFDLESENATLINCILLISITALLVWLHLLYYKIKGNKEEQEVIERYSKESQ